MQLVLLSQKYGKCKWKHSTFLNILHKKVLINVIEKAIENLCCCTIYDLWIWEFIYSLSASICEHIISVAYKSDCRFCFVSIVNLKPKWWFVQKWRKFGCFWHLRTFLWIVMNLIQRVKWFLIVSFVQTKIITIDTHFHFYINLRSCKTFKYWYRSGHLSMLLRDNTGRHMQTILFKSATKKRVLLILSNVPKTKTMLFSKKETCNYFQ